MATIADKEVNKEQEMSLHRILINGLTVLLLPYSATAEGPRVGSDLVRLTSDEIETRKEAYSALKSNITSEVDELIAIASEDPQVRFPLDSPKTLAINLLADYRNPRATNFLIDNITYRPMAFTKPFNFLEPYPCAEALAKIGHPAIQQILLRLSEPATEQELKLFAAIFREVFGEDLGLMHLEYELRNSNSEERPKRLAKLIELYKLGPDFIGPGGEVY